MSLDPSFDQNDSAPDAAAALQALLVVSPDGRIQFATAPADLWMRNLFTAASPLDRLPAALNRWLCDGTSGGPASTFIVKQSGRQLSVRLVCRVANSICVLLEQSPRVPASDGRCRALTERQTEVLSWVARGKTNAEIGQILSLRTRTIGKYLERIFANSASRIAPRRQVSSSGRMATSKSRRTDGVLALLAGPAIRFSIER